jgi:type IX secretion system PorP/SprF family membrane protein
MYSPPKKTLMKKSQSMKKYLAILIALFSVATTKAQFDAMFTQYMFNELVINPAYAGSRECLSATALYRQQWVGLDGAPTTITGSIHAPLMQQKLGVGLSFLNESIGVSRRTGVNLNGAYRIKMDANTLSFGLQLGMVSLSENLAQLNLQNDQQFMINSGKKTAPNFGFGAFYTAPKWYVGLSIPRMLKNRLDVSNGTGEVQNTLALDDFHYFITAGSVISIAPSVKLRPNVMLKAVSGAPMQIDLSANALFNEFIWAGLAYRSGDALSLLLGANITKQIRLGYSYDYTLSALQEFNTGSHEIMLGYDFNYSKDKVVTPRYF